MSWGSKALAIIISMMIASLSLLRALGNYRHVKTPVLSITKNSRPYRAASFVLRRKKDDDYIEAEIVGEEKKNPLSSLIGGSSFLNGEKKEGGVFNKLAKMFGQDEESKRKREQKKAMNTAIDKVFEGTGPLGMLVGGLAKGLGGMVAAAMTEATKDLEEVQDAAIRKLEMSDVCVEALGSNIQLGAPFSSSSSSMNINGDVSKQLFLAMPVSGSRSDGQVQLQAKVSGGRVIFTGLVVQTNNGKVIDVLGSSGSNGGGRSVSGQVIDVEVL